MKETCSHLSNELMLPHKEGQPHNTIQTKESIDRQQLKSDRSKVGRVRIKQEELESMHRNQQGHAEHFDVRNIWGK